LAEGVVVLRGYSLQFVARALSSYLDDLRRDHLVLTPRLRWLREVVTREAAAGLPGPAFRAGPDRAQSNRIDVRRAHGEAPALSTVEAAALLGVSERTVRNWAPILGGVRVGWAWRYDPGVVASIANDRQENIQ
jgi:hypothetical protein